MKNLFILFSLILLLFLGGCSDDKDLSPEDLVLTQTVWKGTLHNYYDGKNYEVLIAFDSELGGSYNILSVDGDTEMRINGLSFGYKIEGRIILINGLNSNVLEGYWWVLKHKKHSLSLATDPETTYSSTMELTQIL